jgi:hypothetical protein
MCHPYLRLTVIREGRHVWKARTAVTVHTCVPYLHYLISLSVS